MINTKFNKLYKKIIAEWNDDEYDCIDRYEPDYENVYFSCVMINLCKIDFIINPDKVTYNIEFSVLESIDQSYYPNDINDVLSQNDVITNLNDGTYDDIQTTSIGTITAEQYQDLKSKYNLTELNNFVFFVSDAIDGGKAEYKGYLHLDEFNRRDYSDWTTDGDYEAEDMPAQNNIIDHEYGLINNTNFDEFSNLLKDILTLCNIPSEDKLPSLKFLNQNIIDDAIKEAWLNC